MSKRANKLGQKECVCIYIYIALDGVNMAF